MGPIVVAVRRNGLVEARHRVHAVAVEGGAVIAEAGEAGLTCFMRSSSKPIQALALARARDDLRGKIVVLLRERAASTAELADKLGLPKGTVGHHVKVLEKAGLIRVVRTRKVRALTEKYYGRTARLFLFKSSDDADGEGVQNVAAASLRTAAEEMLPSVDDDRTSFAVLRARLTPADATRFVRKLERLQREYLAADNPEGEHFGIALALFRRAPDA